MRRAENDVDMAHSTDRNQRVGPLVEQLLSGSQRLALSELTLVEFRANISKNWRVPDPAYAGFDAEWAKRVLRRVMDEISNGRIEIVPKPVHAAEQAVALVDMAARDFAIPLGAWDAIHLLTAAAWAYVENDQVTLYTSDKHFGGFVNHYPHFKEFVEIENLDKGEQAA